MIKTIFLTTALLSIVPNVANAVIIDTFNSGTVVHSRLAPSETNGISYPKEIDGISPRHYSYFSVSDEDEILLPSGFSLNGKPSVLAVSNAPSTSSSLTLSYSGDFNLSPERENYLAFDVNSNDLGVNLILGINNEYFNLPVESGKTGTFQVPFASFPSVDFTQVNSIELTVLGPTDYDFVLDNFRTEANPIPEPSFVLASFTILGLIVVKKLKP